MAHLWACFDESIHSRDSSESLFLLGGAVAPIFPCWAHLIGAWQSRLTAEGIAAMHMTDFARFRKPFDDKKAWPKERREALVRELLDLAHAHLIGETRIGTYLGTVEDVTDLSQQAIEDVYIRNFRRLLQFLSREMSEKWPTGTVGLVLAEHPKLPAIHLFADYYRWASRTRGRFGGITLESSVNHPGLQVADMLAFFAGEQFRQQHGLMPFFSHMTQGGQWVEIFRQAPP